MWAKPEGEEVDATALFCGEDDRFGTHLEVYPRPNGEIYICGIGKSIGSNLCLYDDYLQGTKSSPLVRLGGSDYISTEDLKAGAFLEECDAKDARAEAAKTSFQQMSSRYRSDGQLERVQACMRPCPPDARPYMGSVPGYEGAFLNAGHNCWGEFRNVMVCTA